MKFDPMRHGAGAREFAPKGYDGWDRADRMNAERPGPQGSKWVPWTAVWIKEGISPRPVDRDAVRRYAEAFFETPPIRVQADTYGLIGGAHRLDAAPLAGSDFILIDEVACSDDELPVLAFLDNVAHGLAYSTKERINGLRMLLATAPYSTWSNPRLAALVGVERETVAKYRAPADDGAAAPQPRQDVRGRTYDPAPMTTQRHAQSFDPGPDRDPDEDDRVPDPADDGEEWVAPQLPGFESSPPPLPATVAAAGYVTAYLQKTIGQHVHGLNHAGVDPRTFVEHSDKAVLSDMRSNIDGAIAWLTSCRHRLQD